MSLTGKDIHRAFRCVRPRHARRWRSISKSARRLYNELARELNAHLKDEISITAVRCPSCSEMLLVEHAESHACWLEGK